jgi:hypothetical protein
MVPNELLAQFFIRLGLGDLDIKWHELGEREPEPIVKEISQLNRSQQDAIEGALRSVFDLACESGIDAIFEAALKAGDLDLPQSIPHDVGPYAKAMWTWLQVPRLIHLPSASHWLISGASSVCSYMRCLPCVGVSFGHRTARWRETHRSQHIEKMASESGCPLATIGQGRHRIAQE